MKVLMKSFTKPLNRRGKDVSLLSSFDYGVFLWVGKDGDKKNSIHNQTEGRCFKCTLFLTSVICKRNSFAGVGNQSFRDFQNELSSLQDFLS